jgi:ribonuclease P/MRP protein subunit POP5
MKRLPPSIQEDTRYLRFNIHSEKNPEFSELVNILWDTLLNEVGTLELSEADIWIIKNKYNEDEKQGVIQVNRDMEDQVRAALMFIEEIDGEEAFIEVTQTSGAISNL